MRRKTIMGVKNSVGRVDVGGKRVVGGRHTIFFTVFLVVLTLSLATYIGLEKTVLHGELPPLFYDSETGVGLLGGGLLALWTPGDEVIYSAGPSEYLTSWGSEIYAGYGGWLQVIDASDPINSHIIHSIPDAALPIDSALSTHIPQRISANEFAVASPVETGDVAITDKSQWTPFYLDVGGDAESVAFAGDTLFVGTSSGVVVVDASNPDSPVVGQTLMSGTSITSVHSNGDILFIMVGGTVYLLDAQPPYTQFSTYSFTHGSLEGMETNGDGVLFLTDPTYTDVIDVSNPSTPTLLGSYTGGPGAGRTIDWSNGYLLVTEHDAYISVVDVSDPANPFETSRVRYRDYTTVDGHLLWGGYPNDITDCGVGCFALATAYGGVRIFDFTTPTSGYVCSGAYGDAYCSALTYLPSSGRINSAKMKDGVVFFVDDSGIGSIDFSQDPPLLMDYEPNNNRNNHLIVDGNTAYIGGLYAGLLTVDISDPYNLVYLDSLSGVAPDHYAYHLVKDGSYVYVNFGAGGTMTIADVSDPANILQVGSIDLPGSSYFGYGLAKSGDAVYVPAYDKGLHVVDVSNPAAPTLYQTISGLGNGPIQADVQGGYLYVIDYGYSYHNYVWVYDVSVDPLNPVLVSQYNWGSPAGADDYGAHLRGSKFTVSGDDLFICSGMTGKLHRVDVTNKSAPVWLDLQDTGGCTDPTVSGDWIVVGRGDAGVSAYLGVSGFPDTTSTIGSTTTTAVGTTTTSTPTTTTLPGVQVLAVADSYCYDWDNPADGIPDSCVPGAGYTIVGHHTYNGSVRSVIEFPVNYSGVYGVQLCVDYYGSIWDGGAYDIEALTYEGDGVVGLGDWDSGSSNLGVLFNAGQGVSVYCVDVTSEYNAVSGYLGVVLKRVDELGDDTPDSPDYWYVRSIESGLAPVLFVQESAPTTSSSSTSTVVETTTSTVEGSSSSSTTSTVVETTTTTVLTTSTVVVTTSTMPTTTSLNQTDDEWRAQCVGSGGSVVDPTVLAFGVDWVCECVDPLAEAPEGYYCVFGGPSDADLQAACLMSGGDVVNVSGPLSFFSFLALYDDWTCECPDNRVLNENGFQCDPVSVPSGGGGGGGGRRSVTTSTVVVEDSGGLDEDMNGPVIPPVKEDGLLNSDYSKVIVGGVLLAAMVLATMGGVEFSVRRKRRGGIGRPGKRIGR